MDPERKKVFYYAVGSRVGLLLLSCLSDLLVPDFESDAFRAPAFLENDPRLADYHLWKLFGGLLHWDAHHFLHIAEFGYTYENNIAFFPLFPILIRFTGTILKALHLTRRISSAYLLSAILINNVVFVKSALVLYDLTLYIFNNVKFSYRAAIFYCLSPATVFFIAPYTETLFSFCAFKGMLEFSRRQTNPSLFWFFLSCCLRSNGITFAGFILHAWAYYCLSQISFSSPLRKLKLCLRFTVFTIQYVVIIFCPYLIFQLYCYLRFCHFKPAVSSPILREYADQYKLLMTSDYIGWCFKGIISPYFIVQEKLWDVGFLKYYKLKQIPNFVLASPICYLIIHSGALYLKNNWRLLINPKSIYRFMLFTSEPKKKCPDYPPPVFLFFIHALFLTIWGLVNINVQVLTRLLASSSPILYWIAASAFETLPKKACDTKSKLEYFLLPFERGVELDSKALFVKWYFLLYTVVGIVMFTNGLPWT